MTRKQKQQPVEQKQASLRKERFQQSLSQEQASSVDEATPHHETSFNANLVTVPIGDDSPTILQGRMATKPVEKQTIPPIQFQTSIESAENHTGMPDPLKMGLEKLSGFDLSDMRVHYNSNKPAKLNALAYAQGQEIHLAPGQEHHLPHEGWHVVQQMQGRVQPTMQIKGEVNVNVASALEKEADVMGHKAMQLKLNCFAFPMLLKPAKKNSVVQFWLNSSLFSGRNNEKRFNETSHIYALFKKYESLRQIGQVNDRIQRQNRLKVLHYIQVELLRFLDAPNMADQNINKTFLWAKKLMNNVQKEHEYLVGESIKNDDIKPPVANFNDLPSAEQNKVRQLWKALVDGTGNIKITEMEYFTTDKKSKMKEHVGFKNEMLAQFARLLETSMGREIIGHLSIDTQGQKQITIKPGLSYEAKDGAPSSEAAAASADHTGNDKLKEINIAKMFTKQYNARQKRKVYREKFVELNFASMKGPKERAAAIYKVRKELPAKIGVKVGGRYYKFGSGTAVYIKMTRDIRDAVDHPNSRFVDSNRNEIPTPNYFTLGHELGHALHKQTGVSLEDGETFFTLFDQVAPNENPLDWSNVEEFSNIHSVENAIRAEYGMKDRYGHINQIHVLKTRLSKIEDALDAIEKVIKPINIRRIVNTLVTDINRESGSNNIAAVRRKTRELIEYLSENARNISNSTHKEHQQIKNKLNLSLKGVNSSEPRPIQDAVMQLRGVERLIEEANSRQAGLANANKPERSAPRRRQRQQHVRPSWSNWISSWL